MLEKINKKFVLLSIICTVLFTTVGMNYIRKFNTPDYANVVIESVDNSIIKYRTQDGVPLTTWKSGKLMDNYEVGQTYKMKDLRGRTIRSEFGYAAYVFTWAGLILSLISFCASLAWIGIKFNGQK